MCQWTVISLLSIVSVFEVIRMCHGGVGDRARAECRKYGESMVECQRLLHGSKERVPADILEFPHMVMVGYRQKPDQEINYNCGGTLISPLWVLSAAHCLGDTRTGPPVRVRLGTTTLEEEELEEDIVQERGLVKLVKHPEYKPPAKYNDIALLKMDQPISKLGEHIRIACLQIDHDEGVKVARASGFGKTSFDNKGGSLTMMHVDLDIIPQKQCNQSLRNLNSTSEIGVPEQLLQNLNAIKSVCIDTQEEYFEDDSIHQCKIPQTLTRRGGVLKRGILPSQLCAGDLKKGGRDTCQGDSGGPLQILPEKPDCKKTFFLYMILGVTSFGRFCGFKNSPGVYTRVSHYVGWIEDIVWPETERFKRNIKNNTDQKANTEITSDMNEKDKGLTNLGDKNIDKGAGPKGLGADDFSTRQQTFEMKGPVQTLLSAVKNKGVQKFKKWGGGLCRVIFSDRGF